MLVLGLLDIDNQGTNILISDILLHPLTCRSSCVTFFLLQFESSASVNVDADDDMLDDFFFTAADLKVMEH